MERQFQRPDYSYIGRAACGCVVAVTVDDPTDRKHTGQRVAEFIVDGLVIERMSAAEFRALPHFGCTCPKTVQESMPL
jgi:hypothetical protein